MPSRQTRSNWLAKFAHALRGVRVAALGQSSLHVDVVAAALVVTAGILLRVTRVEWCLLVVCIGLVVAAELMNTAIELLAKAITSDDDPYIRDALDIASAAVLLAAAAALVVGVIVLGFRAGVQWGWWGYAGLT